MHLFYSIVSSFVTAVLIFFIYKKYFYKSNYSDYKTFIRNDIDVFVKMVGSFPVNSDYTVTVINAEDSILIYAVSTSKANDIQLLYLGDEPPSRFIYTINNDIKYLTFYFPNNKHVEYYFDSKNNIWMYIEDLLDRDNMFVYPEPVAVPVIIH